MIDMQHFSHASVKFYYTEKIEIITHFLISSINVRVSVTMEL